jgi:hypothetical protein
MLFVYVTLLSTGPSWLFTLFAIWTALLPDFLVAIWETYSAGGGVLVNKVRFSVIIFKNDFNSIVNVYNGKFRNTRQNRFYGKNWTAHFLCYLKRVWVNWEFLSGVEIDPLQPKAPPNRHHMNHVVTAIPRCIMNLGLTAISNCIVNLFVTTISKRTRNLGVTAMSE